MSQLEITLLFLCRNPFPKTNNVNNLTPIVINIIFLLTMLVHHQEKMLFEFIKKK